ncbi:Peroxidasin [Gryllus bimaculatus]|nr:Peroxidasin [Gryllus bimaculatus]
MRQPPCGCPERRQASAPRQDVGAGCRVQDAWSVAITDIAARQPPPAPHFTEMYEERTEIPQLLTRRQTTLRIWRLTQQLELPESTVRVELNVVEENSTKRSTAHDSSTNTNTTTVAIYLKLTVTKKNNNFSGLISEKHNLRSCGPQSPESYVVAKQDHFRMSNIAEEIYQPPSEINITRGTHVNASRNLLSQLPRPPALSARVEALDVSFNRVGDSGDELRSLRALRRLDLADNELESLPGGAFAGLSSLLVLDLTRAGLQRLESGSFRGLAHLQELLLSENRLSALPPAVFSETPRLETLALARNAIGALPAAALANLAALRRLDLSGNALTSVAGDAFAGARRLEWLSLEGNALDALPAGAFAGLAQLEGLRLAHNALAALPAGAFAGLAGLRELSLAGNRLARVPEGALAELRRLEGVALEGNRLEELPPRLFAALPALAAVSGWVVLSSSRWWEVECVEVAFFMGGWAVDMVVRSRKRDSPSLENVDLSHNELSSLPEGLFASASQLSSLDLSHNSFTALGARDLAGLSAVTSLDLAHNLLAELPVYGADWPQVTLARFGSRVRALGERAGRAWLGDGAARRNVRVDGLLRDAASLRWTLRDPALRAQPHPFDCACGSVRRGLRRLEFASTCPAAPRPRRPPRRPPTGRPPRSKVLPLEVTALNVISLGIYYSSEELFLSIFLKPGYTNIAFRTHQALNQKSRVAS